MRVTMNPGIDLGEPSVRDSVIRDSSGAVVIRYAPRRWFLAAPLLLIAATLVVFLALMPLGDRLAYVAGVLVYWLAAGVLLPLLLVGREGYDGMFAKPVVQRDWSLRLGLLLLALPVIAGFLFVFPSLFPVESNVLLPLMAAYAIVNGFCEEVFWRGMFARRFGAHPWLGVVYPAVLFSIWQLVPWALFRGRLDVPAVVFMAAALGIGLVYNWVAWRTRSIRWTTLAHVLTNLSGIGTLLVFWPGF